MFDIFMKAWNQEDLPHQARAFLKFFWTALRGALYAGVAAGLMYLTTYHPARTDIPFWVGGAMAAETLLVSVGKWWSAQHQERLGDMIQQAAEPAAQAILAIGRRNDPAVPLEMPDLSIPEPLEAPPPPPLATTPETEWLLAPE